MRGSQPLTLNPSPRGEGLYDNLIFSPSPTGRRGRGMRGYKGLLLNLMTLLPPGEGAGG